MMDRVMLWEMSQIRRRDLLELAGATRQRELGWPRPVLARTVPVLARIVPVARMVVLTRVVVMKRNVAIKRIVPLAGIKSYGTRHEGTIAECGAFSPGAAILCTTSQTTGRAKERE